MKSTVIRLSTGIKIGDRWIKSFEINETTLKDIMDAEASVSKDDLVRLGLETLARRVKDYDGKPGPMPPELLYSMTDTDYLLLTRQVEKFDNENLASALKEVGLDAGR